MDDETRILFESDLLSLAKARVREGRLTQRSGSGTAKNPFCGDEIAVDLVVADGVLKTVGYEAKACSLCVASAELLSQWVEQHGGSAAELSALAEAVQGVLKGQDAPAGFEALASVAPFRARHKCVTLPFDAAQKAVNTAVEEIET
ncbi:iron-sulfur cluster assembly scaffold protein [Alphaproteobacteria bacterium]|nr:iron-sulfur cluster assembly scaffold protein [Alphaproteobacteria bacterium]